MTRPAELTVVVPAYREGEGIVPTIEAIENRLSTPHETIVVYDTPDDPTAPVAARLAGVFPAVRPLLNTLGPGAANAVRAGFTAACGELVVVAMADGSDDPEDIERIVAMLRAGADIVSPSRYGPGGSREGGPFLKGLLSRAAGLSLYWTGALPVRDATNAFKGFRRHVLRSVPTESNEAFAYTLELMAKARERGFSLEEFPTRWRDRTTGASNFKVLASLPAYLKWYCRALFRSA